MINPWKCPLMPKLTMRLALARSQPISACAVAVGGSPLGYLVDALAHQQRAEGVGGGLDDDQVDQVEVPGQVQAPDAQETRHRHRGEGSLPAGLLQHGLEYLVEGVGGRPEEDHQQVELERVLPIVQPDERGEGPGEQGQGEHRHQEKREAQPERVAEQKAQGVRKMLGIDLGHEAREDLAGADAGHDQQHVDQAEKNGIGGELPHRQPADHQQQRADPGHRSQRLPHQEVLHPGRDAARAVGVRLAARHRGVIDMRHRRRVGRRSRGGQCGVRMRLRRGLIVPRAASRAQPTDLAGTG